MTYRTMREPVRPIPANHVALPTVTMADWSRSLRWWKPETGIPRRCPDCNAQVMVEPPLWDRSGRVVCGLGAGCGRDIAWISNVGWET